MEKINISTPRLANSQLCISVQRENYIRALNPVISTVCDVVISVVLANGISCSYTPTNSYIQRISNPSSNLGEINICIDDQFFSSAQFLGSREFVWAFHSDAPIMEEDSLIQTSHRQGGLSMVNRGVPTAFIICGLVFLTLFVLCSFLLASGLKSGYFPIGPQILLVLAVGFFGMSVTDLVAIMEWRKKLGWKERERP